MTKKFKQVYESVLNEANDYDISYSLEYTGKKNQMVIYLISNYILNNSFVQSLHDLQEIEQTMVNIIDMIDVYSRQRKFKKINYDSKLIKIENRNKLKISSKITFIPPENSNLENLENEIKNIITRVVPGNIKVRTIK